MIGRGFTVTIMSPIWAASNTNQEQFKIDGVLRAENDTPFADPLLIACLRAKMIEKRAFFALKQGCDKLGIGEGRAIVHESFFDFEKFPQPVGETALQPTAFVATKPWRTPRFGEVKRKKRRWKIKNGKMELRSPHDTEPDAAADADGRVVDAPRRAADAGVADPAAAAQQTVRASRGSCGICRAS